jgi:hypothetical protein
MRHPPTNPTAGARFDQIESETRSRFFSWSHFLRKTGVHFSGKCSMLFLAAAFARIVISTFRPAL